MAKICPNCHKEKEGKFCDRCGAELIPNPAVDTNKPFKMFGHSSCPGCEYDLDHGHQRFCPGCGHPLVWTCR